jgi:hypothetical protein
MRILGDSQITNASIQATNIVSSGLTSKLQTYQLTDNMRTISNSTVIDLDFGVGSSVVDCVSLCGSNLSSAATVQLSYSDTNILAPDTTITLSDYSPLNQVFFLDTAISKRYWRISISDVTLSNILIGYIYIGKYFQVPWVEFGHEPFLQLNSTSSVTSTGQGYGIKTYNSMPVNFTMYMNYDDLDTYLSILQEKQNIDPVLLVEYDESYTLSLYRPKYGVLSNTSTAYPISGNNYAYTISGRLEERF